MLSKSTDQTLKGIFISLKQVIVMQDGMYPSLHQTEFLSLRHYV